MTKVDIKSVTCAGCRLPASVNADGMCAFCARPSRAEQPYRFSQTFAALLALVGLIAIVAITVELLTRWGAVK